MANKIAIVETNKGTNKFELLEEPCAENGENFVLLAEKGYTMGYLSSRDQKLMIQGGDPLGMGYGGESPGAESLTMKSTARRSFTQADTPKARGDGKCRAEHKWFTIFYHACDYPLPPSYTKFGKVIEGQDVIDAIAEVETNPR